ncbi:DUF885 domain-containing protein [Novosphingobium resinovorum]|uniref:Twin-arginine translocation pathway signal n=1 Tax=Novosphingobium resinovorum TaxID=158500 RepID=A0A1D8A1W5_9SPHN|nr:MULTISPECIES: DUF885 domain-containing protein [Sphingomonadaceae]AOR76111.1 twin-arginine translocation pathway signal [Novosphingobium resinovorum]EJU13182.1 twin-arginine translocation pathway signal [Sphingomonas sp. LH128]MBF7011505.1 DUF885 domain-containing protein [Novosphingobium sp. HR1a]WJM29479.1 DUF885 domain-containing protein [Novosphingobium resinovorum]
MSHTSHSISRRSAIHLLAAGTAAAALPARAFATSPARPDAAALLDEIAWSLLDHVPESATGLGVDTGAHHALRSRMEDRSQAGRDAYAATLRKGLARIEAFNAKGLDHSTRTSIAVVKSAFATALEGFALPYGDVAVGGWRNTPYVVIQNVGAYLDAPRFLDADHPVNTPADADAWIARLSQLDDQLDGERGRIIDAAAKGLVPPDFLLDRAIAQMTSTIADARKDGGSLAASIAGRTGKMSGTWATDARRIIAADVMPALERQLAELQRQRGLAKSDPGMRERPQGSEYYAWALRASTTTRVPPEDVHQRGLQELAELHARMDPILKSLGYTTGTVGARMTALGEDKRFLFAEGDPGRAEILAFIQKRVDWIRAQMPRAFRELVPGNVEVRRLPLSEEPGAPTAYGGAGSKDGTVPGKMWINLRSTDLHRKYDLPTLVHHEAIPGHVWQGEYANRLPLIRSILAFNAYSEGWALYGEQLADELGAYDDDPVGRLGYLQSLAFRACRMVVDTGLHAKGWTREEAVRFFMEKNGNKREEVVNEVDRYCSWPGQACGYKMGHSQIVAQRKRAQDALGSAYDLRDYDQTIVDGGNVPLDVLAQNVSEYIATKKK